MGNEGSRLPSYDSEISRLFFSISVIIPITLIAALVLYREPFHFLRNAFSQLGEMVTPQGRSNLLSRLVFSIGWLACSMIMTRISFHFSKNHELRNHSLKRWLALAGGTGFFVAITPNDISHILHSVGMGLVVAVPYFFGVIFLLELRSTIPTFTFYAYMIFLQSTVLTYAVAFSLDSVIKQAAQKLCVIGLLLVVEKASTIAPEGFEWRTAIQVIRK